MRTRGLLVLCGLAGLGGCSFNTASLVDGGPDVPGDTVNDLAPDTGTDTGTDTGIDVPADVGFDVPVNQPPEATGCRNDVPTDCTRDASVDVPTNDAGFTMVGRWRIVSGSLASLWMLTDTGANRVNGLSSVTTRSITVGTTVVTADRIGLTHSLSVPYCPVFRTVESNAAGMLGHLDGPTSFTVTAPSTSATTSFAEVGGRLQVTIPIGFLDWNLVSVLDRFNPPTGLDARSVYSSMLTVYFGDGTCEATSRLAMTAPRFTLLWEHPCTGIGVQAMPVARTLVPTGAFGIGWIDSFLWTVPVAPPAELRQMIYGGEAAIAYLVVFNDANGNNRLDHVWTGDPTGPDQVWGISNEALVWRGPRVPTCGEDQSSFIDTYEGFQLVTLGTDFRSNGGTAPWLVVDSVPVTVGAFPEDPTHPNPPSIAVQAAAIAPTHALPRLLR